MNDTSVMELVALARLIREIAIIAGCVMLLRRLWRET